MARGYDERGEPFDDEYPHGNVKVEQGVRPARHKMYLDNGQAIKGCPFCGGYTLLGHVVGLGLFRIKCHNCGAEGGHGEFERDAVKAWNQRAQQAN